MDMPAWSRHAELSKTRTPSRYRVCSFVTRKRETHEDHEDAFPKKNSLKLLVCLFDVLASTSTDDRRLEREPRHEVEEAHRAGGSRRPSVTLPKLVFVGSVIGLLNAA